MRIYVEMSYTIAVDIDPETYDVTDRVALAEACAADSDFYEAFPNGPRPFYDCDWEVVTDADQMTHLDGERAFHAVSVEYITTQPTVAVTPCGEPAPYFVLGGQPCNLPNGHDGKHDRVGEET